MNRRDYSWGKMIWSWVNFTEGIVVYHYLGLQWTLVYAGVWIALGVGVRIGREAEKA